jgi:uncharacterized protein YbjQ (UPF0145 family)
MRKLAVCLAATLTLAGCSTLSPRRNADEARVEVFTSGSPKKPFVKVGRIDFHLEKGGTGEPSIDDFRFDLQHRARLVGADAVMDLEWTLKGTPETGIYHVTATGIAYVASVGQPGSTQVAPGEPPPAPTTAGALAEALPAPSPGRTTGDVDVVSGTPTRAFTTVSRINLYVEKKTRGEPSLEDVLPELKRQARLSGAEAITDVHWTLSDAGVYHVTATGIAYAPPAASSVPVNGGPR